MTPYRPRARRSCFAAAILLALIAKAKARSFPARCNQAKPDGMITLERCLAGSWARTRTTTIAPSDESTRPDSHAGATRPHRSVLPRAAFLQTLHRIESRAHRRSALPMRKGPRRRRSHASESRPRPLSLWRLSDLRPPSWPRRGPRDRSAHALAGAHHRGRRGRRALALLAPERERPERGSARAARRRSPTRRAVRASLSSA